MEIGWLGHSSLRLRSGNTTLITDPYSSATGFTFPKQAADIVTTSNSHPNHSHSSAVEGKPRVMAGPGEYEIAGFYITGMGTNGGAEEGERKLNTIFIMRAEGLTLCHLGDITRPVSSRQADELRQTDVLFVPVGGVCTMEVSKVAELVNMIGPRIVIPIHYRIDSLKVELEPLDVFLRQMGVSDAPPQNRFNVTQTNLPRETRIVPLQRST